MTTWNTPDGLKAFEIIGRGEWEEEGHLFELSYYSTTKWWVYWATGTPDNACRHISGHEAACILNDAAEKWLVERGMAVYRVRGGVVAADTGHGEDILGMDMYVCKSTALIQAVLEVNEVQS